MRENQPKYDGVRWRGQGKVRRGKNRKMKVKTHQRVADKREGGYAAVQGVNKEDERTE